jgi:aspartate-semialdehyde dehydrogenase
MRVDTLMGSTGLRLAIAGATGLVGQQLLRIIQAQGPKIGELGLFASSHSAGQVQHWLGREWTVRDLAHCDFAQYDLAFFCIGDELSAKYVPEALAAGCAVVDKSNAFRLDPAVPLVVSGVNDAAITAESKLVANPNCSTIILAHALAPLLRSFGLERVWAATYQSVSGAGGPGVEQLAVELAQAGAPSAMLERPELGTGGFAYNVVPGIGRLDSLGRCGEEAKLVDETRKILAQPGLIVIAHAARVPVVIGHSIAVTVELGQSVTEAGLINTWQAAPDVRYMGGELPQPIASARHDRVEAGRLRPEPQLKHGWSFFVSGDNLRLGAALNGWRIMQRMLDAGVIKQYSVNAGGTHA